MKKCVLSLFMMMMIIPSFSQVTGDRYDTFVDGTSIYDDGSRENRWEGISSNLHRITPSGNDALIVHDADLYGILMVRLDSLLTLSQPDLVGSIQAKNGVYLNGDTLKLGGDLTENTQIDLDSFKLTLDTGYVEITSYEGYEIINEPLDLGAYIPGANAPGVRMQYIDPATNQGHQVGILDYTQLGGKIQSIVLINDQNNGDTWGLRVQDKTTQIEFIEGGANTISQISVDSFKVELAYHYAGADHIEIRIDENIQFLDDTSGDIATFQNDGNINFANLPAYDDDTAAGVGGLSSGDLYLTTGLGAAPLDVQNMMMVKQ